MTITSPHNEKLKGIRRLHTGRREGRFVAEGEDLLAAADAAGWPALERLVAAGSGLAGTEVEPALLDRVSALGSGTRAIGVFAERWAERAAGPVCVALFGVRDPGNVGTVLRSAAAFGAGSVGIAAGTADPFGAKAVRASMGAVFAVPVARVEDLDALPGEKVALVAGAPEPLRGPLAPCTLLVGAEREGLPDCVVSRADRVATVPIRFESLNAAMAATVALYEVTRQP